MLNNREIVQKYGCSVAIKQHGKYPHLVLSVSQFALENFFPMNRLAEKLILDQWIYKYVERNWAFFYGEPMPIEKRARFNQYLNNSFKIRFRSLEGTVETSVDNTKTEHCLYLDIFLCLDVSMEQDLEISTGLSPREIDSAIQLFYRNPLKIDDDESVVFFENPAQIVKIFFKETIRDLVVDKDYRKKRVELKHLFRND